MTIELSREVENQLKETAQAQGVSVSQYFENLVAETTLRRNANRRVPGCHCRTHGFAECR